MPRVPRPASLVGGLVALGVVALLAMHTHTATTAAPPLTVYPPMLTQTQPTGLTVEALRRGGYVLFFRHTVADQGMDANVIALEDCRTQRNTGPQGLVDARTIGEAFRLLSIPVGQVWSSEFCRALETATLAFRRVQPEMGLNFCISTDGGTTCSDQRPLTQEQRTKYLERALTGMPSPGTNTVLVGHGVGIVADLQMGEAAIYRPDGMGGFVRVARVLPSEWLSGVYRGGDSR